MNRIALITECCKVRQALELAAKQNMCPDAWFYMFPKGTCGITSNVLGLWLYRHDPIGKYEYVWGWYNSQSHAWIEHNGYIIDITADQFEGISDKVIITKNREFHDRFEIEGRHGISKSISGLVMELYQFVCCNVE